MLPVLTALKSNTVLVVINPNVIISRHTLVSSVVGIPLKKYPNTVYTSFDIGITGFKIFYRWVPIYKFVQK